MRPPNDDESEIWPVVTPICAPSVALSCTLVPVVGMMLVYALYTLPIAIADPVAGIGIVAI